MLCFPVTYLVFKNGPILLYGIRVIHFPRIFITAENVVISPNFQAWKFCGKAQFPAKRPKLCGNCASQFPHDEIR